MQKYVIFVEKESYKSFLKVYIIGKLKIIVIIQENIEAAAHSICNLKFNVPNEIHEVFHNGSNYDYHFIIKELADEFVGKFECLGENTEKCKTFPLSIEKEVIKNDKNSNERNVTNYILQNKID